MVLTFGIREAYRIGLRLVRRALMQHGLLVPVELDVASRIKQELGAVLGPCTVLFVDDPALLLEGIVFHQGAALGIPQPIVISGSDRHTKVLIRSAKPSVLEGFPVSAQGPLLQLEERIVRAMETIAEREEAYYSSTPELSSSHSKDPYSIRNATTHD